MIKLTINYGESTYSCWMVYLVVLVNIMKKFELINWCRKKDKTIAG